jgi:hypothetical protein
VVRHGLTRVHAGLASDEDARRYSADVPTSRTSTSTLLGEGHDPGALVRPGLSTLHPGIGGWLEGGRQREWLASAARSLAGPGRRVVAT